VSGRDIIVDGRKDSSQQRLALTVLMNMAVSLLMLMWRNMASTSDPTGLVILARNRGF
jgi:hypothetical protein